MLSTDLVVSFGRSLNDYAKTSGHGQRRLAWVGPGVLTDNAYGAAPWPPARFMDEGGGGKGVASANVDDRNKRVPPPPPPPLPPPPLHHFQQQQLQQSSLHHQQQYKIYQQYRMRQQQQPSQKYPAEVIAAANAAAVVANSAALPSKLQHPLLQQSFPSSITNNNGVVNGTAAAISAPYVDAADRSDSGLGSSRTLNSGDERSGSHSSAFSGSDELHAAAPSPLNDQHTTLPQSAFNTTPVWRDPNMMQVICVQYPDGEGFFSHFTKRLQERRCFDGRQQLLGP